MNNKKIIICIFFGLLIPVYNFSMLSRLAERVDTVLTRFAEGLDWIIFPGSEVDLVQLERNLNHSESEHAVVSIPSQDDIMPTEIEDLQAICMFVFAGWLVQEVIKKRISTSCPFTRNISSLDPLPEEGAKSSLSPNHELHNQPRSIRMVRSESSVAIEETDAILSSGVFRTISSETMINRSNISSPNNRQQEEDWIVVSQVGGTSKKN